MVATPIGNLEDISLRALYLLNHADLIACEDTRVTNKLLQSYGIVKPLKSCHEHNLDKVLPELLNLLASGKIIAYTTDAGMPLISDPGFELVKACKQNNIFVTVIPGPSAPLSALVLSGLPCHEFFFAGFLPAKSNARKERIKNLLGFGTTLVFFEAPHRLMAALQDIAGLASAITVSVVRELTKKFEEVKTGPVEEILSYYEQHPPKGEIVLLVAPVKETIESNQVIEQRLQKYLEVYTLKEAVGKIAAETKRSKKQVYQLALQLKDGHKETKV